MSFPRYPAYKPSGVEWLGEVPEHWSLAPLKKLLDIQNGSDYKVVEAEDGYPVIGSGGPFAFASQYHYDGESVLLGRKGTIDRPLYIRERFWAVDTMYWSKIRDGAHGKFAFYTSQCIPFQYYSTNTALPSMTKSLLGSHIIAFPCETEQGAIATFLDRETAKIDALIAEQQRLIELLQEKRQAVISHAVTKGLHPDAPMKDSGVEWLGEVPEHWTVMPLRLAARIESGHTPSRSHEEYWIEKDCVYPWFTLGDVWQIRDGKAEYVFETQEKVSQVGLDNSAARMLPANTVILSRTASVGFSGILGVPMATTQDFVNWVCGPKIAPEFLLFVFRAMSKEFERLKYGSTHNTIYMPDIFSFRVALPSLIEQGEIVSNVRESLRRLDGSFDDLLSSKELLQERRSALISAAVTGQIDVRGLVPEASAA
jgi:type I restriction enzyme, S subunit